MPEKKAAGNNFNKKSRNQKGRCNFLRNTPCSIFLPIESIRIYANSLAKKKIKIIE
jgi:hypothetical protein